ncbi:MAG TPA: DUF5947 family protein [Lacipirellulaceae bacterium]|nr:DUF5947 family protein [Lacipirellulaceae bacterium]
MSTSLPLPTKVSDVGTTLRRFVAKPAEVERCELCGAELRSEHEHLIEPATRRILCACDSCVILFGYQAETKYKRVPRRIEVLVNFCLSDEAWNGLGIPINLAFLFRSSAAGRVVAMFPSPGGCTESLLRFDTWDELVADNPALGKLQPDVEALLINRMQCNRAYYRAPIDECYKLAGLIRSHWSGLSGGTEVWRNVDHFFRDLDAQVAQRT